jgi:hypothetical protein
MSAETQVAATIAEAVNETAKAPNNNLTPYDAKPVADSLIDKLGPLILNATNNEPWWASRVIWGALLAAAGTIAQPLTGYGLGIDEVKTKEIVDALATGGQVVGLALVIIGRLTTRKPIGN